MASTEDGIELQEHHVYKDDDPEFQQWLQGKAAEEGKEDPYAAPDGGWGWLVMVASFICCLVLDGIAYVFGVFLKPMIAHYGVENAQMALVGSVLSGTIQLVGPFVALMVNLLGTR